MLLGPDRFSMPIRIAEGPIRFYFLILLEFQLVPADPLLPCSPADSHVSCPPLRRTLDLIPLRRPACRQEGIKSRGVCLVESDVGDIRAGKKESRKNLVQALLLVRPFYRFINVNPIENGYNSGPLFFSNIGDSA